MRNMRYMHRYIKFFRRVIILSHPSVNCIGSRFYAYELNILKWLRSVTWRASTRWEAYGGVVVKIWLSPWWWHVFKLPRVPPRHPQLSEFIPQRPRHPAFPKVSSIPKTFQPETVLGHSEAFTTPKPSTVQMPKFPTLNQMLSATVHQNLCHSLHSSILPHVENV